VRPIVTITSVLLIATITHGLLIAMIMTATSAAKRW
jgi:hypothetical protein